MVVALAASLHDTAVAVDEIAVMVAQRMLCPIYDVLLDMTTAVGIYDHTGMVLVDVVSPAGCEAVQMAGCTGILALDPLASE